MSAFCAHCDRPVKARGLCQSHYQLWYRREGHKLAPVKPKPPPPPPPAEPLDTLPDDWTTNAACSRPDIDPALFFPPEGRYGHIGRQGDAARTICSRCPVQLACLTYAVRAGLVDGIWGGLDPSERKAEVRRRKGASRAG